MAGRPIDPKYLKGLKIRGAEGKEVVEDGRKVIRYALLEKPMSPEDVLDWKDTGAGIVIVTADGRKLNIQKEQKEKEKKE